MNGEPGRVTRRSCLLTALSAPVGWGMAAPRLLVRRDGPNLRISAPQIRFLAGKPLEQLHNGLNVSFISQVSLAMDSPSNVLARLADRFVVSYDLWEEKFSATRLSSMQRTVARMSAPATETWCLDHLLPIPPALTAVRPFWIRLELRAEDPKDSGAIVGEPGINLTKLVEIFSRPPRNQQPRWVETEGPLRLEDLR